MHERGQVAGRSEEVERLVSVRRSAAVAIDEADDLQSVLGMVSDLVGQQARDLTRPDDDDVLDVRGVSPSHDSRDRPEQRNEQDRDRPEDDEAREVRMRQADDLGDRHEPPGADRDHLQDAEDVVDGRVVGSLLVSIVEAVHARDEHPEGEARDEECDLPARVDLIDRGFGRDQRESEQERGQEPDEIGDEQQPAHEPATAPQGRHGSLDLRNDRAITRCDDKAVARCCPQLNPPLHARLPAMRFPPSSPG